MRPQPRAALAETMRVEQAARLARIRESFFGLAARCVLSSLGSYAGRYTPVADNFTAIAAQKEAQYLVQNERSVEHMLSHLRYPLAGCHVCTCCPFQILLRRYSVPPAL